MLICRDWCITYQMTPPYLISAAIALTAVASVACPGADARLDANRERPSAASTMAIVLDTARLQRAYDRASELPRLRSLLVQWKGDVTGEEYYHGATRQTSANIKSASKSIISALVGIAIEKGKIRDVSYGWWTRTAHGLDIHYAWGYGGQFIFLVPGLKLVVVATPNADSPRDGGQTGEIHRILEKEIIPAVSRRVE